MQLRWTDLADSDLEKIEAYITKDSNSVVSIDVVMNIIDSSHQFCLSTLVLDAKDA